MKGISHTASMKRILSCNFQSIYSTTLVQCRTRTTLFPNSTGLLERSTFMIVEKIARVANDTRSRLFVSIDRSIDCNEGHVAILLDCPIEILRISGYSDTSCTFIFSQHCYSTYTNISIINTQASNIKSNTYSLLRKLYYTYSNLYTCFCDN